ncbi:hypothetical protein [Streptomyces sp. NPDC008121]|uniref:hypothetical protein n=1 Tax=Streptomyces sp. NPDC008121 TaxID=3364809 RepID=UPI0036E7FC5F
MSLPRKAAVAAVLAACLTGHLAGTATAAPPGPDAAAPAAPGAQNCWCEYNTVDVSNGTGERLTLTALEVTGTVDPGRNYGYHEAVVHGYDGLWTPVVGDTLEAGATRSYGVIFWGAMGDTPSVTLTFEDADGNKTAYKTSTAVGGASFFEEVNRTGLRTEGHGAAFGQHTVLKVVKDQTAPAS